MQSTNKYLDTLLKVNNIESVKELSSVVGSYSGRLVRYYRPAKEIAYKYIMIVKLTKAGITIPYHHRPRCIECGEVYLPEKVRQWYCSECKGNAGFSLSIGDYIELGFSPQKIAAIVGLPATKEVIELLSNWNEEESLEKLEQIID